MDFAWFSVRQTLKKQDSFEYEFCSRAPKLSNQITVFIGYDILSGCLSNMSRKFVLKHFITLRSALIFKTKIQNT